MKKPKLILLSLFILLTFCSVFYNVLDVDVYQNNSVEDGLNTSDPAILEWSRFWGGDQYDTGRALITDSNGNVIVVGQTSSFGSDYDLCLLKYSPSGEVIWNSTILVGGNHWPNKIALDSLENIYVVGTITSGTFPNIDQDMFIFKFDSSGSLLWQKYWGGSDRDYGSELIVDSFDNIYVAGETNSYGAGSGDTYILKYNSTGAKIWEVLWGGTNSEALSKIALDSNDEIYITGGTRIGDWYKIYLVKYNHSGSVIWERIWDLGFTVDYSEDMVIDSLDNIYLTGYTTRWSSSDLSVLLIKYNSSGEELWWESWRYYELGYDDIKGLMLALDSEEDIYIAGRCDLDLYPEDRDVFLIKIDSLGVKQWYNIWGGDSLDSVRKIFVDPSDDIFLIGSTSSYGEDLYLLKYSTSGTFLDDLYWGGSNYITNWDMTIDILGNIYATGEFDDLGPTNDDLYLVKFDNADPQIEILSPVQNQQFGNMTFNFNLTIVEPSLDQTWYTLNDSTKFFFTGTTGVINQTAWDMFVNGVISLKFYANDSIGNIGYAEVVIHKDFDLPFISIISPVSDSFYETDPPDYNITYGGNNINSKWYSLNNGPIHIFSGNSGTINKSSWSSCLDGKVVIKFYINDSSGWNTFDQVIVNKDTLAPVINILDPTPNQLCGYKTIDYSLEVIEIYLDSYWYTLDGGVTNITLSSFNGTLDQNEWNKYGNGTVTIKFYANDSLGHLCIAQVTIRKEATPPLITIVSPSENDVFSIVAPTFELEILEPDLDTAWYSLDDGLTIFMFTGLTGSIDQAEWDKYGSGIITITFYANDSYGYDNFAQVTVQKDIGPPTIIIHSPINGTVFSTSAPNFNITVLDSQLDSIWYTIDNGLTNISIISTVGTISQVEWDKKGEESIELRFYANDTLGNTAYSYVMIVKDTIQPLITIDNPTLNELTGTMAPSFNISIVELNLDLIWYTLDDGDTNVSLFSQSGKINQAEWNKVGNGTVIIKFYVKDAAGNLGTAQVTIFKDIIAPIITINSPDNSDIFLYSAPEYNISIIDPNLDLVWYTLDGGSTNFIVVSTTGTIDQFEWNKFGNGTITLTFGANDSIGNGGMSQIIIHKDINAPYITINSPQQDEIFSPLAPTFDLTVIDLQLDSIWYTVDDGITNISIISTNGVIDQNEWNKLDEGSIFIRFYANDTLGNKDFSEVIITKDVFHGIDLVELLKPSTYSHITSNFIDFSWFSIDAVFGAVNFTLQISNTSDFSYILYQSGDIAETPVFTNYSVQLSIIQGEFFWRVRPTFERFNGSWSNYFFFTLHINNYAPDLVLNDFSPSVGTKFTIFRFTAIYTDLDNNAPDNVKIFINGIGFSMEMSNPSDSDFTDGCIYQYLTLLLPSSTAYIISFECSDGAFYYTTNTFTGPLVELEAPPDGEQGLDNLNSTNAMIMGISVVTGLGIIIPMVVITEIKIKKHKIKPKEHSKIKK
ncbi:MAG: SBBP repeat-containing protein [Promethearchaeota archaeon]